jgi:hypothetical protein
MPTTAPDWSALLVEMYAIKRAIWDADVERLWEQRLPAVAASEAELRAVERKLSEPLDPRYRAFLSHAGGWPAFHQAIDLFGPGDLNGGERMANAEQLLQDLEPNVLESSRLRRSELLPIAASRDDLDVFAIARHSSSQPGIVVWFAANEVERYPTFDDYFLAMMEYARQQLQRMRSKLS